MLSLDKYLLVIFTSLILYGCGHIPRLVILHDPLSVDEHIELGWIYEKEGRFYEAEKEYQKALKKDSKRWQIYLNIGNIEFKSGRFSKAEYYYRKGLSFYSAPSLLNNLALTLIKEGEVGEEPYLLLHEALLLDPDHTYIYFDTLAQLMFARNEFAQAEDFWKRALVFMPSDMKEMKREIKRRLNILKKMESY